jgi:hypothetical protein
VLVDSRRAVANCVKHALASIGPPLHATFARLAGEAVAEACVAAYRSRYLTHGFAETSVIEGMDDALASLEEPAIVVTSKPAALAEPLLEAVGLRPRFAAVFGPSLSERAEPKAATLARALDARGSAGAAGLTGAAPNVVRLCAEFRSGRPGTTNESVLHEHSRKPRGDERTRRAHSFLTSRRRQAHA